MKKGKWNYTENIEYTVLLVKVLAVKEPKMHWQNAFVNEERQVVLVKCKGGHQFWIDNQDGSGLLKISKGGGPDSYSAHINEFEFIRELQEREWQQFDKIKFELSRMKVEDWQICKCGVVFTLLLTGTGLSHWNTVNEIMQDVLAVVGEKYTNIETMRNDDNFYCLILKQED